MVQWWADFLDVNRQSSVSPYDFARDGMFRENNHFITIY
jgi:hypothetical protein